MKAEKKTPEKEKTNSRKKGDGGMINLTVFTKLVEGVTRVTEKTLDFMDSKKYTESVNELTEGYDAVFEEIKNSIIRDESLTEAEKRQALLSLNDEIAKRKENAGKDIREHQNQSGQLVLKIFAGLMTAGVYFAPEVISRVKQQLSDKDGMALEQMAKGKEVKAVAIEEN